MFVCGYRSKVTGTCLSVRTPYYASSIRDSHCGSCLISAFIQEVCRKGKLFRAFVENKLTHRVRHVRALLKELGSFSVRAFNLRVFEVATPDERTIGPLLLLQDTALAFRACSGLITTYVTLESLS